MAYIWEDYDEALEYRRGNVVSPYIEMLPNDSLIRYVNPLLRFAAVFDALSDLRSEGYETDDEQGWAADNINNNNLDNILLHYLALVDRTKGIDRRQIQADALEKEIGEGLFGNAVCKNWNKIRRRDKAVILNTMVLKYGFGIVDNYFFVAVQKLFTQVSLIFEEDTKVHYLYISENEDEYNKILIETAKILLWDIQCSLQIVWRYHYGIIGNGDTMKISEIRIV